MAMIPPGTILEDRFSIARELGRGGMGIVYEAMDIESENWVAIKVCDSATVEDRRRFCREVRAMSKIIHPHVLQIIWSKLEGDLLFYVMPRACGSLEDELQQLAEDPAGAITAFIDILDGVQAIHAAGATHRDLKPSNALRFEDGSVVIADLGLVKFEERDTGPLTQTAQFLGTRKYCAPEQLLPGGSRDADARTDIYQLGKTLYEMLTGEDSAVIDPERLPTGLQQVVLRACQQRPKDRYQSVGELRDAIEMYLVARNPDSRPLERLNSLFEETKALLLENRYDSYKLKGICQLLAAIEVKDEEYRQLVDRLDDRLLPVLATTFAEELLPVLQRYEAAVEREVRSFNFSEGEYIAKRMQVIYTRTALSDLAALALSISIIAAVELNRFAAMEIVDEMLKDCSNDDKAQVIGAMLQKMAPRYRTLADRVQGDHLNPILRAVRDRILSTED